MKFPFAKIARITRIYSRRHCVAHKTPDRPLQAGQVFLFFSAFPLSLKAKWKGRQFFHPPQCPQGKDKSAFRPPLLGDCTGKQRKFWPPLWKNALFWWKNRHFWGKVSYHQVDESGRLRFSFAPLPQRDWSPPSILELTSEESQPVGYPTPRVNTAHL